MTSRVAAVVDRRRTLWLLVSRDLKVRYADSVLGYLWTVLDPLMMALVYWFVFTKIFTGRDVGAEPYILFLLMGLLPWNWTNGVMNDAARALTAEAKIVRSSNLVREIWVVRIVVSKYMEFLFSLPVLLLFMLLYHDQIGIGSPVEPGGGYLSWRVLGVPIAMTIQFVLLIGVGMLLAPLTVLFNDVQRLVRIFLRVLFYFSPVIYGTENVPAAVRSFFAFNPLTGIFELYRVALFPSQFAGWRFVAVSAAVSVGIFVLGAWVFRRLEGLVLKEI